jgi:hypothetical protein
MRKIEGVGSIYFPAVSVGALAAAFKKNTPHFANGRSPRYFSKNEKSHFFYPYLLSSCAHNYKDSNYRENIGFERDSKGLLFGDSGGYQILTGKGSKDFDRKVSFEWLEKNCDIFPLLDKPFPKNYIKITQSQFDEHLNFTKETAKFFLDKKTKDDNIILNVIQGRDLNEMVSWYEGMKDYKFDGWAFGGYTMTQILSNFFHLLSIGEIDNCNLYHVFMLSKVKYIIYLVYLQHRMRKEGYGVTISYDSSTPNILTAFGSVIYSNTLNGFISIKYSNKYDFSMTPDDVHVPCS